MNNNCDSCYWIYVYHKSINEMRRQRDEVIEQLSKQKEEELEFLKGIRDVENSDYMAIFERIKQLEGENK